MATPFLTYFLNPSKPCQLAILIPKHLFKKEITFLLEDFKDAKGNPLNKGWISIKDITMEHKIASLTYNKELIYINPIEIISFDCDEDLYEINSNQISLKVTKNHRMYVGNRNGNNYNIKLANECYGKRITYLKNCELWIPDFKNYCPQELCLNENKIYADHFIINDSKNNTYTYNLNSWIKLFGIWIAEGHCYKNKNNNYSNKNINQMLKKEEIAICI